jgi:hypothetical protein
MAKTFPLFLSGHCKPACSVVSNVALLKYYLQMKHMLLAATAACLVTAATSVRADEAANNGTDPTRLTTQAVVNWERVDLKGGFVSDTLKLNYTVPVGEKRDWSIRYRLPLASVNVLGNNSYALGDASVQATHVYGLSRKGGWVAQAEMVFDTASRDELGTGKNVVKGTLVKAWFLSDGSIFAPALVHSESLWGDSHRSGVRATTLDLYYVPKLSDPRNLITVDPSINRDWKSEKSFVGLAVTFGRVLGPALGGTGIVSLKPSLFAGDGRPGGWGVELGFKVLGF